MVHRTVPVPRIEVTGSAPVLPCPELQSHILELECDAALPLDARVFSDVEIQLNEGNSPPLIPVLLPPLQRIIMNSTSRDVKPAIELITKLLAPLPYRECLTITDEPTLVMAFNAASPSAVRLAVAILAKAAQSADGAAALGNMPHLFKALVTQWMLHPDTGVAENAAKVLGDLLEVDSTIGDDGKRWHPSGYSRHNMNGDAPTGQLVDSALTSTRSPGSGRLWPLFLNDAECLSIIVDACTSPDRNTYAVSISQGRLLRLLPRLATIDFQKLCGSGPPTFSFPVPDEARAYGNNLLHWAGLFMVDYDDVLMRMNLHEFIERLVSLMRISTRSRSCWIVWKNFVEHALQWHKDLKNTLNELPGKTVEEEAEPLRQYIRQLIA